MNQSTPPANGANAVNLPSAPPAPEISRVQIAFFAAAAFAADYALWRHQGGGYAMAVFVLVVLVVCNVHAWATRREIAPVWSTAMLLLVAARCAYSMTPLVGVVAGVSALAAALAASGAARAESALLAVWLAPLGAWARVQRLWTQQLRPVLGGARLPSVEAVIYPLVAPALFAALFAEANQAFAQSLVRLLQSLWDSVPNPARVVVWGAVFWWIGCVLVPTAKLRGHLVDVREFTSKISGFESVDVEASRNTLISLNLLFAVFLFIDMQYLWRGVAPAGMDTQSYAHQGATVLGIVGVLVGLVLVVLHWNGQLRGGVRSLSYLWVGQSLLLSLAVLRRMQIHVHCIGLSDLHFVGFVGAVMVIAGLLTVLQVLRSYKPIEWLLLRGYAIAFFGAVAYAVTPTYALSARYNVNRIQSGDLRPLMRLVELSREIEAAPQLLPLLSHPNAVVREGVASMLSWKFSPTKRPIASDDIAGRELNDRVRGVAVIGEQDEEHAAAAHNAFVTFAMAQIPDWAQEKRVELETRYTRGRGSL